METKKVTTNREMVLTRVINAPRELVWEAWTNPKHVQQWWGPNGFTNPVCEWEAKPGSKIMVHMKGPDGTVYPMSGEFVELVKLERLVFVSAALDQNGKRLFEVMNTITFNELGNKTELIVKVNVSKVTSEAEQYLAGMNEGWNQSIDRLSKLLDMLK